MILERILRGCLVDGIANLALDTKDAREFFEDEVGLDEAEAKIVAEAIQSAPPDIGFGYLRRDSKFPAWRIILTGDNANSEFIGNEGVPDENGVPTYALMSGVQATLIIYTQNPELTQYHYNLAKHFILSRWPRFQNAHWFAVSYTGTDLAPDERLIPSGIFARRLTLSARREFQASDAEGTIRRAFRVVGIHVDGDGAPHEDIGDVLDHVTIQTEDSDGDEEE